MNNWVILTFLYAIILGFYNCCKKKAVKMNSIYEVFAYFSLIALILTILINKDTIFIKTEYLTMIIIKAIILSVSWLIAGYAINKIPISLYAVIMLSKIIFSILLSIILLGESLTLTTLIGMIFVLCGLFLVNSDFEKKGKGEKEEKKEISIKQLVLLLFSCLLGSISSILDKKILLNITSSQLQFWFLLFLTIILWIVLIFKEKKCNFKLVKYNYWILIMAMTLVLSDRLLFMANEIPESKVSIMTIIKQISTIEIILLGKIMFKEKQILKKMLCSLIIIIGILITIL